MKHEAIAEGNRVYHRGLRKWGRVARAGFNNRGDVEVYLESGGIGTVYWFGENITLEGPIRAVNE